MKKYIVTIIIIISMQQAHAYQNPYQQMWFNGVWRKNCTYNIQLQMCEQESESFKNFKEHNTYHNEVNGFYCKNGYMYQAMGFSQKLVLQTMSNGLPMACSLTTTPSYKTSPYYKQQQLKQQIKQEQRRIKHEQRKYR